MNQSSPRARLTAKRSRPRLRKATSPAGNFTPRKARTSGWRFCEILWHRYEDVVVFVDAVSTDFCGALPALVAEKNETMIVLPAIDLMDGQVVRLRQGKASEKTIYSNDPVAFAKKWEDEGGDFLHIVDLDAAFTGVQRNLDAVKQIASAISIPCELGGGMRSETAIQRALDAGVTRVVIGTRAAESLDFVAEMVAKFGSEKIAVGIDAKNGQVSVKGWTELSSLTALDLAQRAEAAGAGTIIYTDIATDGMLEGPNFAHIEKLL